MKKWIMGVVMAGMMSASAWGYDTDVFKECSVAVKPNVLFLMDTSKSMRTQDVIDSGIAPYDDTADYWKGYNGVSYKGKKSLLGNLIEENEKEILFYWDGVSIWFTFDSLATWGNNDTVDDLSCEEAKKVINKFGFYDGPLSPSNGKCERYLGVRTVAKGNYINYLEYVKSKQNEVDWSAPDYKGYYKNSSGAWGGVDYRDMFRSYGSNLGYGEYERDRVYVKMGMIRPFNRFKNSGKGMKIDDIKCSDAYKELTKDGWTKRKVKGTTGACGGKITYTLMTGNFLNFLDMKKSRRYNGIDAMWSVIKDKQYDIRFGIMQFDLNDYWSLGGATHWKSNGGDLAAPCGSSLQTLARVLYGTYPSGSTEYGQPLHFGHKNDLSKETPLAESLVEAGLYFAGQQSWFNDYNFDSGFFDNSHSSHPNVSGTSCYQTPMQCPDQENHIIVITDGSPKDDFGWLDSNAELVTFDSDDFTYKWIYDQTKKTFPYYDENKGESGGWLEDKTIGNSDGDAEDVICWTKNSCSESNLRQLWLDDVADYLYKHDFSPMDGEQKIKTHVVGFSLEANSDDFNRQLMTDTAQNGSKTQAHYASNKEKLIQGLNSILHTVEASFSFSRAATPINQADMIYSSDDIFVATFTLNSIGRGMGNIQKFKRAGEVVVGQGDTPLFETNGSVDTAVKDYWAVSNGTTTKKDSTDASIPDQGVASRLYRKINNGLTLPDSPSSTDIFDAVKERRNIYVAYKDGSTWRQGVLADLATDGVDGGAPTLAIKKDDTNNYEGERLAHFLATEVYGYGYEWPLGDIIHSNIVVAQYPKDETREYESQSYIFAGANDGQLHCFDANGEEVWAFVFPNFVNRLRYLCGTSEVSGRWFADGFMTLYYGLVKYDDSSTKVDNDEDSYSYVVRKPEYLVIGERRAGSYYHIFDVSHVNDAFNNVPVYKARVGGTTGWGLSWSKPQLCQVATSGGVKKGFLVAGGYDENQDKLRPGVDKKGRFVALFDLEGDLIKRFPATGFGSDACIISARIIDHDHERNVNDKRIFSRIYAGDLNGNVYHMSDDLTADFQDKEPNGGWNVGHKLFSAQTFNVVVTENGTNHQVDYHQKLFHAPVAGYACDTKMVFFGTGDREHPLYADPGFVDSVYAVPERWSGEALACRDLSQVMVTMQPNPATVGSGVELESYSISKNPPERTTSCKESCSEEAVACSANCLDAYDPERCETECSESCLDADAPAICETACVEACLEAVDPEPCEEECSSAHGDCVARCDEGEVKGWFFNFPYKRYKGNVLVDTPGEKMISEPLVVGNNMIFGTYTPPVVVPADPSDICNPAAECEPGAGRIYVVNTCHNAFSIKSYVIKNNPMPQPALVFDKNTGKVLISTGEGKIIDPEIPVVVPDYWKHSGADL